VFLGKTIDILEEQIALGMLVDKKFPSRRMIDSSGHKTSKVG